MSIVELKQNEFSVVSGGVEWMGMAELALNTTSVYVGKTPHEIGNTFGAVSGIALSLILLPALPGGICMFPVKVGLAVGFQYAGSWAGSFGGWYYEKSRQVQE